MKFYGLQKTSLIEYPRKIVSVVFTGGCNFRCPFCHNRDLVLNFDKLEEIDETEVIKHLENNKKLIDGIAVTGGEPTLHPKLPDFFRKIKDMGLLTELETNGTNPEMISQLIKEKLVDYFAIDIKCPLDEKRYYETAGGAKNNTLKYLKKTISLVQNSGVDYEFRTTLVPGLITKKDVYLIAEQLKGSKKYVIQKFLPNSTLDPEYEKKEILSPEFFNEFKEKLKGHFGELLVRD